MRVAGNPAELFPFPLKVYYSFPKMCSSKQPHSQDSERQRNASSEVLSGDEQKHMSGCDLRVGLTAPGKRAEHTAVTNAQSPPR